MQNHAADKLHIEVPLAERALGCLPHSGEGFGQEIVDGLAIGEALAEFHRLGAQLLAGERLELGLKGVDRWDPRVEAFQAPVVGTAENLGCESAKRNHGSRASLPRYENAAHRQWGRLPAPSAAVAFLAGLFSK